MAKRRGRHGSKILGISDKGWDTIWKGFKWYLIIGGVVTGVVIIGGVVMFAASGALSGPMGAVAMRRALPAPPVRVL